MNLHDWLRDNPQIRTVQVAAADLNGQARGKRLPARNAEKALSGALRFPLSVLNLDICGDDIADSPLVLASGDRDGVLRPTGRGFVPVPWLDTPTALLPVWMFGEDGRPFAGDPRHALAAVVGRYGERGLTPVVATELEFFLVDDSGEDGLRPPRSPRSGRRPRTGEILSLRALDRFDAFFSDLYAACEAMDVPADAAISESGLAQYEINLAHRADALRAADDAWLFKMLVRGLARRHGFAATFLAKPYDCFAGSGMHMHFSVLDAEGRNVFDDGTERGSDTLLHAIAGCLKAMPGCTLIFAPHDNSYARMVPGEHAPTGICWAHENRTAAIRVPGGAPASRRIEHRVAGGDVNPYLVIAAVLGAALNGIADARMPPEPVSGNAYEADLPHIPARWEEAVERFATDPETARIFAPELIRNYVMTKRQELRRMRARPPQERIEIYLETV